MIFGRARFVPDTPTGSTVVKVTRLRTPVIATGLPKTFGKQYVKEGAPLRTETTAYQRRERSLAKAIANRPRVRQVLAGSKDRYLRAQQDVLAS